MTDREVLIFAPVLHGVHIPLFGGKSLWADMVAFAKGLLTPMRQFLTGLTARHIIQKGFSYVNEISQNDRAAKLADAINQKKATNHPVLRKQSVSGGETLFVDAAFTEAINKLAADGSDAAVRHRYSRIDNPRYQMWVKWWPETVVMWDNWVTQYCACGDHYPSLPGVQRVTVSAPRFASPELN